MNRPEPLDLRSLVRETDQELIGLLKTLSPGDWNRKVNRLWSVKDTAAHLLDGNLRRLAFQRDQHPPPLPKTDPVNHKSMIKFLAGLNREWVNVSKRFSPRLIVELIEYTSHKAAELFDNLNMQEDAPFAVSWAGQTTSPNWFDIAREYTEKWYHQQQIRSLTGHDLLTDNKWLEPLINTFMRGMPYAFDRYAPECEEGTSVQVTISGSFIQLWVIHKEPDGWQLYLGKAANPVSVIQSKADIAWKIFSKWENSVQLKSKLWVDGDTSYIEAFTGLTAYVK